MLKAYRVSILTALGVGRTANQSDLKPFQENLDLGGTVCHHLQFALSIRRAREQALLRHNQDATGNYVVCKHNVGSSKSTRSLSRSRSISSSRSRSRSSSVDSRSSSRTVTRSRSRSPKPDSKSSSRIRSRSRSPSHSNSISKTKSNVQFEIRAERERDTSLDNFYLFFMDNKQEHESWLDRAKNSLMSLSFARKYENMYQALDEVIKEDDNYGEQRARTHIVSVLYNKSKIPQSHAILSSAEEYYKDIAEFLKTDEKREQFRKVLETKYCPMYQEECDATIKTIKTKGSKYILLAVLLRYKGYKQFIKEEIDNLKVNDMKGIIIEMIKDNDIWFEDMRNLKKTLSSEVDSKVTVNTLRDLKNTLYEEIEEYVDENDDLHDEDDEDQSILSLSEKNRNKYKSKKIILKPRHDVPVVLQYIGKKSKLPITMFPKETVFDRFSFIPKQFDIIWWNDNTQKSERALLSLNVQDTIESLDKFVWVSDADEEEDKNYMIFMNVSARKPKKKTRESEN